MEWGYEVTENNNNNSKSRKKTVENGKKKKRTRIQMPEIPLTLNRHCVIDVWKRILYRKNSATNDYYRTLTHTIWRMLCSVSWLMSVLAVVIIEVAKCTVFFFFIFTFIIFPFFIVVFVLTRCWNRLTN